MEYRPTKSHQQSSFVSNQEEDLRLNSLLWAHSQKNGDSRAAKDVILEVIKTCHATGDKPCAYIEMYAWATYADLPGSLRSRREACQKAVAASKRVRPNDPHIENVKTIVEGMMQMISEHTEEILALNFSAPKEDKMAKWEAKCRASAHSYRFGAFGYWLAMLQDGIRFYHEAKANQGLFSKSRVKLSCIAYMSSSHESIVEKTISSDNKLQVTEHHEKECSIPQDFHMLIEACAWRYLALLTRDDPAMADNLCWNAIYTLSELTSWLKDERIVEVIRYDMELLSDVMVKTMGADDDEDTGVGELLCGLNIGGAGEADREMEIREILLGMSVEEYTVKADAEGDREDVDMMEE